MPVADLFDWINRRFACGSLSLERGSVTRSFHFDSGYVTNASSNDPSEHLGQILVKRGLCDEQALNDAFRVQSDTGVLLGKILLMVGAVTEEALRETLDVKISEAVCEAMSWTEGTFSFEPDPTTLTVSEYEVSVNLEEAIDAGRARAESWQEVRRLIPSDDVGLWLRDKEAFPNDDPLIILIERGRTVGQIVMEHQGLRFEVMSALADLIRSDAVAIDQRKDVRPSDGEMSPAALEEAVRGRAAGGDRSGALALVESALDKDPENAHVLKLQKELERSVFAELSKSMLTSFRVPKLLKSKEELENLDLDKAERYLANRIDGRWDLFSLMRVAPLRQIDALMAFRSLADRGIISL
jgi:hypothetical protein